MLSIANFGIEEIIAHLGEIYAQELQAAVDIGQRWVALSQSWNALSFEARSTLEGCAIEQSLIEAHKAFWLNYHNCKFYTVELLATAYCKQFYHNWLAEKGLTSLRKMDDRKAYHDDCLARSREFPSPEENAQYRKDYVDISALWKPLEELEIKYYPEAGYLYWPYYFPVDYVEAQVAYYTAEMKLMSIAKTKSELIYEGFSAFCNENNQKKVPYLNHQKQIEGFRQREDLLSVDKRVFSSKM